MRAIKTYKFVFFISSLLFLNSICLLAVEYKVGDKVKFRYQRENISGTVEKITESQVILNSDNCSIGYKRKYMNWQDRVKFYPDDQQQYTKYLQKIQTEKNTLQVDLDKKNSKKNKLISTIINKGHVAFFTENSLYMLSGAKKLYHYPGIDSPCVVYNNYMLFESAVYRVNKNVINGDQRLKQLTTNINNAKRKITITLDVMSKRSKIINDNIEKIQDILKKPSASNTSFFNAFGEYIGTAYREETLSQTQRNLIKDYNKECRKLNRKNRVDKGAVSSAKNYIIGQQQKLAKVNKAIANFQSYKNIANVSSSNNTRSITVHPKAVIAKDPSKTPIKKTATVEERLKILNKLLEKKLISQKIYDKRAAEIVKDI